MTSEIKPNWDFTKVEDLRPYERNAKKHDKAQIDNVAKSISEFGMVQPIVIDRDNNVIIGHCRLLACKKLGLDVVPTVKLEDLSPAEANKLRLLDNKLNESEWDFELIAEDIPEIDFTGYDIEWDIFNDVEDNTKEIKDINYHESISVVIDCDNDDEAEQIFNDLTERGYVCHISTL